MSVASGSHCPSPSAIPPALAVRMLEAFDLVLVLGADLRCTYATSEVADLLGRRAESLIGVAILDVVPAGAREQLRGALDDARSTAEVIAVELGTSWREVAGVRVVRDADAIIVRLVARARADGAAVDDALERSRYLRAVLDTVPECVKVIARDGTLLDINPAGLAMVGATSLDEVRGRSIYAHVEERDRARYREHHAAVFAGESSDFEYGLVALDGQHKRLESQVAPLRAEDGSVVAMLSVTRDVTERRAAAEAEACARATADLQRAQLEAVLDALPAGVLIADADGQIVRATRQAREIWGGDVEAEGIGDYAQYRSRRRDTGQLLAPEDRALVRALRGETTPPVELDLDRLDGGTATVLSAGAPVRDADGRIIGGVVAMTDVSERVRLEAQLRQAQKMEAVGQLAGGIAHDFNNLLTVINGNLEFARDDLGPGHPVQDDLDAVATAAERARTLVRQLLAFSRKQVIQTRPIDVNEVVRGADSLLRRVLGDEIVFSTTLAPAEAVVRADRGQLEQILMNLAVNARDAMLTTLDGSAGRGGTLTIGTDVVTLTPKDAAAWAPLAAGRYVRLTVSDTGHGMDATTSAHIFEPFFTTKAVGAGTGLGLATVYGIVVQSGGAVRVASAPGAGATFTILLPHLSVPAGSVARGPETPLPTGRGTMLVVEDEATVRVTTRRVLERQGYEVVEARHGADALAVWREHRDGIVGCVTDLRMPEMGGRELVALLRADHPSLPVVYVSGYNDEGASPAPGPGDAFVEKPFTAEALLAAVQSAMTTDLTMAAGA